MIPPAAEREVHSKGSMDSVAFGISLKHSAHVMGILRDQLYSDRIMAILREYSSNAWDAQREAGRGDQPIDVFLPTPIDPTLRITDRGPGLSPDDVREIFSQYGASTKRGSNLAVGMLGIGSKAGFAYSDSFTIISRHGGFRRTYVAVLDESEKGRIDLLAEEPCGAETGVTIEIACRPSDIPAFEERGRRLFTHFAPRPTINLDLPDPMSGRELPGLGTVHEMDSVLGRKTWVVMMGCVPYEIDLMQLSGMEVPLSSHARNLGGLLPFGIGELQVSASREGLKYGDATKLALVKRINAIIEEYVRTLFLGFEDLSDWEKRLRIRVVAEMYLPIPKEYAPWRDNYVTLDPLNNKKAEHFRLATIERYNRRSVATGSVHAIRGSRLVLKDDRRAIKGYTFGDADVIVVPLVGTEPDAALQEIKGRIKEAKLEGIPIIRISSIPWTKPIRAPSARDPEKARANIFLFEGNPYHDRPSDGWEPYTGKPSADDIHVVIEGYHIQHPQGRDRMRDTFGEMWERDKRLLELVGMEMPDLIGYKQTKTKEVDRAKLKGTEYHTWRKDGMIKLLLQDVKLKAAVETLILAETGHQWRTIDAGPLADGLGKDHPLVILAKSAQKAQADLYKMQYDLKEAARYVRTHIPDDGAVIQDLSRYPLLAHFGFEAINEPDARDLWIEYVKERDAACSQGPSSSTSGSSSPILKGKT